MDIVNSHHAFSGLLHNLSSNYDCRI